MTPLVAVLAAAASAWIGAVSAADRSVTLAVDNMICASCPFIVKNTLADVAGVRHVEVSFEAKTASIVYDDEVATPDALVDATTNAGYPSHVLP